MGGREETRGGAFLIEVVRDVARRILGEAAKAHRQDVSTHLARLDRVAWVLQIGKAHPATTTFDTVPPGKSPSSPRQELIGLDRVTVSTLLCTLLNSFDACLPTMHTQSVLVLTREVPKSRAAVTEYLRNGRRCDIYSLLRIRVSFLPSPTWKTLFT